MLVRSTVAVAAALVAGAVYLGLVRSDALLIDLTAMSKFAICL
jgi:hypothetical protein